MANRCCGTHSAVCATKDALATPRKKSPTSTVSDAIDLDLLALDQALDRLGQEDPEERSVVELRFFGGLDAAETARLLEVSESTVLREWRAARAWLTVQLGGAAR